MVDAMRGGMVRGAACNISHAGISCFGVSCQKLGAVLFHVGSQT